jgi:negative regulator of flagellin synthesis FlgM
MKVNSNNSSIELNAYLKSIQQQQKTADPANQSVAKQGQEGDKVNLSNQARVIQQAAQAAKNTSDVDEKKVEQVKMEVDKGTYKVNGAQVATGMLREAFENNLILQKVNTRV